MSIRLLGILSLVLTLSFGQEIRKFDQATLEKLGVAIFEQDIRAARATDMLMAKKLDWKSEGLRGWIVEGDAKSMLVRFVRDRAGVLEAFYDVRFEGRAKPVLEEPKDRHLTDRQLAQFKARTLTASHITRPASRSYNMVILPDPERDGLLVYALAATSKPGIIMVGGHYRFTVSKDGEKLEQADELFRSFMEIDKKQNGSDGGNVVGTAVTTLISDMPLETHVYLSLLHKIPFYVSTRDQRIWKVEAGRISPIEGAGMAK